MKKNIFIACCFLLFLSQVTFASYAIEVDRKVPRDSKVNVQIYVPSLLLGVVSGDINFKLSERVTLGPQASYYSYGGYKGYDVGLSMNYSLSGDVFNDRTWLLNPYVSYTYSDLSYDVLENKKIKKGGIITGANLVYQWMWDCGVNVHLGVGAYYSSKKPLLHIGETHIGGMCLLSIGYAF